MPSNELSVSAVEGEEPRTQFDYLLNAFELASQSLQPSKNGYAEKRRALFDYVRTVERERDEAIKNVAMLKQLNEYGRWFGDDMKAAAEKAERELTALRAQVAGLEAQLAAIQSWRLSADLTPTQDGVLAVLASRSSTRMYLSVTPHRERP